MSSAGLIMLQDALEIVILAMLVERDVDEQKTLESKTFDELMGELKKAGVAVPKSGTLKALNKQRVITKHYGQLAEPLTVQVYAEATEVAIDSIVPQVLGKGLQRRWLEHKRNDDNIPLHEDDPLYEKASQESRVVHKINAEFEYSPYSVVSGFNPKERYILIHGYKPDPKGNPFGEFVSGYLLLQDET